VWGTLGRGLEKQFKLGSWETGSLLSFREVEIVPIKIKKGPCAFLYNTEERSVQTCTERG
jgi:hypothetical protein